MKKIIILGAIIATLTGCFAGTENSISKHGGFIGTHKSDYIIVNTTGSMILDVYKLRNTYVSENQNTDGINFKHPVSGSHVTIQGDVKIIRNPNSREWDLYKEYHADELFMEQL